MENIDKVLNSINGLYQNQIVLNEKLDGIINLLGKLSNEISILDLKQMVCNENTQKNNNKLSDMEILLTNISIDLDNISSGIGDINPNIDSLKQEIRQDKLYKDIYDDNY